jgi:hypothetical protein
MGITPCSYGSYIKMYMKNSIITRGGTHPA